MLSDTAQLFIYNEDKRLEGLVIPGPPFGKEGTDRLGRGFCHTNTVRSTKDLKLSSKNRARCERSQFGMLSSGSANSKLRE